MARLSSQHGWILHRRAWRETSLLVELFSLEHGRVGLVARGARAARSSWRGLGEPFIPLECEWTRRGEMGTLTRLEPAGTRPQLPGRRLWCGLYANELLIHLVERDEPVPELFAGYERLLASLGGDDDPGDALRRFELALLRVLGVAPDLTREAGAGEPIAPEAWYRLEPESGFFPVPDGHGRGVYSGEAILSLARGAAADSTLRRQAREITRCLLDHQLGGRVLKTRELFRSLQ